MGDTARKSELLMLGTKTHLANLQNITVYLDHHQLLCQ
jgi:hypothetical protein